MQIANIKNASPEQLRELQLTELEILKKLKKILNEHNLTFFIIGGTLIGAIRNKGFVPWDDDVDVLMFREDFEKLYQHPEWLEGTNLVIQRSNAEINQHLTGMNLKDITTTFINKHSVRENIIHSIGIDILPLDYRPVGKFKRYLQIFYASIFSLYNADRLPDHQGVLLRTIAKLPLNLVKSRKKKYKIWKWAQRKMVNLGDKNSGEVVELGVGYKALFRYNSLNWFKSTINKKFEDVTMPVPIGYDNYLRAVVGDYMQFPPKSSRKPKHNTYLVDTETPYSKKMRKQFIENENED
uniref:Lipopolysaccharide cholinephosphotransferase LicD3 n=1 Tax=Loigolactobacillus rennini TaxID=238013 RepID=A0A1K2IBL5_9LACO|nr:Lipopolysaccharide cholinephosphotransferase LicD3 [Loigolactobacillus rennini]